MNPNNYKVQQNRAKYRKIRLIEKAGGGCEQCGYNNNISALVFHHVDEDNKNFGLDSRRLSNTSWSKILNEFEKCKCLCANCHRETHNPTQKLSNVKQNLKEKYNPNQNYENNCIDCGVIISPRADRCKSCGYKSREKINWPPTNWLVEKSSEYSFRALSRRLGVSGNAIRKRIKNHRN